MIGHIWLISIALAFSLLGVDGQCSGVNPLTAWSGVGIVEAIGPYPPGQMCIYQITPTATGMTTDFVSITFTLLDFPAGDTLVVTSGTDTLLSLGGSATATTPLTITSNSGSAGSNTVQVTWTASPLSPGTFQGFQFDYIGRSVPPHVSGINPQSGPINGGTPITLTGSNFGIDALDLVTVSIGALACNPFIYVSPSQITCTTPPGSPGPANPTVVVSSSLARPNTFDLSFNYIAPPANVTGISPPIGLFNGGDLVTLTGTFLGINLNDIQSIMFGPSPCNPTAWFNATQIQCVTTAAAAPGPVIIDVIITTSGGLDGTASVPWIYYAQPPVVTFVTGTIKGPIGGGSNFTVGGNFLGTDANDVRIYVGTVQCASQNYVDPTTVSCITGVSMLGGFMPIRVQTTSSNVVIVSSFNFQYVRAAPSILNVSPSAGVYAGGQNITITGVRVGQSISDASVKIGTIPCSIISVTGDTTVICTTGPASAAGSFRVILTTVSSDNASSSEVVNFQYYQPPASVTGVSPSQGPAAGGTLLNITGSNLGLNPSDSTVRIAGVICTVQTASPSAITCITGAATVAGQLDFSIDVTTLASGSLAGSSSVTFHIVPPAATITSITPSNGRYLGGTAITVMGRNLGIAIGDISATIGGQSCSVVSFINSTAIILSTPAAASPAALTFNLLITTTSSGGLTSINTQTFTYFSPAARVTAINQRSNVQGEFVGGEIVTLTGSNLGQSAADVAFIDLGGSNCTNLVYTSPASLHCTTGEAVIDGTFPIVIYTYSSGIEPGTSTATFTYRPIAIFIESPTTSFVWVKGTPQVITYRVPAVVPAVTITLSNNAGTFVTNLIVNLTTFGSSYNVPAAAFDTAPTGKDFLITMSAVNFTSLSAQSSIFRIFDTNYVFTLNPPMPASVQQGQPTTLSWAATPLIDYIQLQFRQGSGSYTVASWAIPNTGSYLWTVPYSLVAANDYTIRLADAVDTNIATGTQPLTVTMAPPSPSASSSTSSMTSSSSSSTPGGSSSSSSPDYPTALKTYMHLFKTQENLAFNVLEWMIQHELAAVLNSTVDQFRIGGLITGPNSTANVPAGSMIVIIDLKQVPGGEDPNAILTRFQDAVRGYPSAPFWTAIQDTVYLATINHKVVPGNGLPADGRYVPVETPPASTAHKITLSFLSLFLVLIFTSWTFY